MSLVRRQLVDGMPVVPPTAGGEVCERLAAHRLLPEAASQCASRCRVTFLGRCRRHWGTRRCVQGSARAFVASVSQVSLSSVPTLFGGLILPGRFIVRRREDTFALCARGCVTDGQVKYHVADVYLLWKQQPKRQAVTRLHVKWISREWCTCWI